MPTVNLTDEEWRVAMAVLAKGPWDVVNPLLMKMGDQLRAQAAGRAALEGAPTTPIKRDKPTIVKENKHDQH